MTTPAAFNADTWRSHLIEDDAGIAQLLARTRRVAVLGIKVRETGEPAYYVAEYAQRAGYDVIPVPVYYPDVREILGQPVYRTVSDVPGVIDMVNVFRPSARINAHLDEDRKSTRLNSSHRH